MAETTSAVVPPVVAAAAIADSAAASSKATTKSTAASTISSSSSNRPIHPAFLTTFGPGKGSGSAELSAWAYLTRPRPSSSATSSASTSTSTAASTTPLPNLVTAHSNSLRVYTVLPNAGTLALTAVYDNLAGTICSLDVIPNGTCSYGSNSKKSVVPNENGGANNVNNSSDDSRSSRESDSYDGLLLGFAGHPRLSLVYPSSPMVGGGTSSGVGQGGVLLASSIIDLTSALMERSMGGTSFLEQDMIVTVSTSATTSATAESSSTATTDNANVMDEDDPPCVSVVLGGGVAIASFSLPKGPRPCENNNDSSSSSTSSWWRVASEPYVLPLSSLSAKTRDLGSSGIIASATTTTATNITGRGSSSRTNPETAVGLGPSVSHGMGDIIDVTYLSGYTEPTLLVLHSNPRRGGGRAWSGRLGRTAEVPLTTTTTAATTTASGEEYGDDDDDDMDTMDGEHKSSSRRVETTTLMPTGTKYGLTLTAISLALHQHRSVVLWSLMDALPADAWKLIPHSTASNGDGGVLVWGVNTIVYVSMGGKIKCALAVNGFAKVGCPPGLLPPPPPPPSRGGRNLSKWSSSSGGTAVHLEANPSPLPPLALQLDGASRVSFITDNVALVCIGNGTLHLLELHNYSSTSTMKMFMSLFPLGHKIGGLGSVASCLSVLLANTAFHAKCLSRYLGEEEDDNLNPDDSIVSNTAVRKPSPKIQARGLIFVGSRMGDCTLLAFSMNDPIQLVATDDIDIDVDGSEKAGGNLQPDAKVIPYTQSSMSSGGLDSGEPLRKQRRLEMSQVVKILDDEFEDNNDADNSNAHGQNTDQLEASVALSREEILRLEEEELYRMDDDDDCAAPSIISSYNEDSDALDNEEINADGNGDGDDTPRITHRSARYLSMFRSIHALDSLTGLGPLGGGCYGPVATCPSLTEQDANMNASSWHAQEPQHEASFSNAFSSAARHYIMPCGFGSSGGLAVLTTPGRDNVGGSILCESDLCNMAGPIFGLPHSNLVLLGKADVGSIVLRGVLRGGEGTDNENNLAVEEFEEVDIDQSAPSDSDDTMEIETPPSFNVASDVLGKMTLLAATEFCSDSLSYSMLFVRVHHPEISHAYAIVIMSNDEDKKESELGLTVDFVHTIDDDESDNAFFNKDNARGMLASITPIVSKFSEGTSTLSSVTFGCVWTSGNASIFDIALGSQASVNDKIAGFTVSESVFVGDCDYDANFYDSNRLVAMDVISLPNHIFDMPDPVSNDADEHLLGTSSSVPTPDQASSLSFPPDRLSMHGTWCAKLDDIHSYQSFPSTLSHSRIVVVIGRRSGLLQIYDHEEVLASPLVEFSSESTGASPIWQAHGCSHGSAILGESPSGAKLRRPDHHEVEAAEIRLFVAGPSLQPESISGNMSPIDEEKDSWMLRSLCILVDTSQGDLQLYSASKSGSNMNRLRFSRVPLSNVSRPSEEAGRHLVKLRRKGIVPQVTTMQFRPNRLHRFFDISGEDGLFAATPRPLWFVSERGAPTVVSHKSRHVSPAGGRPVPVSGFCTTMPAVFQKARSGFITLHERIGRVGSQRLTLYNGLWDVFAPHGLLPGGGLSVQKVPLGVTVRHIEFIDDASISTTSRPVYAMLVSHEIEDDQSDLNDDGLSSEERLRIKDMKEAVRVRKQVEADLGGFDVEQEWVEEIEREDCFAIDPGLGLAPSIPIRKYELWLADASSRWNILDKYQLDEFEHGTALKVMYLTDVVEDSDEVPEKILVIGVGASVISHDGEDIASKGRVLLFQIKKSKKRALSKGENLTSLVLALKSEKDMALGPVTSLSSLKSENIHRVVVGAGAEVTVEQWGNGKLTQVGFYHAHMQVQEIVLFKTFFLLSDAYDSLHFLVWRESDRSLTLLAKDYEPTQVFAAGLISRGGAMAFVCHDDRQNLSFLQYAPTDAVARGGNKLVCRADFHMGTQTTSFQSHWGHSSLLFNSCTPTSTLAALKQQDSLFGRLEDDQRFVINFGTTDGSFCSIVPLSEPTYWRLTALQSVMSNALESNCALSHRAWRLYRRSTRRAGSRSNDRMKGVIDGDLVYKFADLSLPEQEDLASSIGSTVGLVMDNLLELGCAASVC